jgi:anti-sigma factor RsiW
MMKNRTPDWCTLNGYVDGELSRKDAADVARAAADSPGVADDIALLNRLKGGVQDAFPAAPADLASLIPAEKPWRLPMRAAACLALFAAAAAMLLMALWPAGLTPGDNGMLLEARNLHSHWLIQDREGPVDSPPVVLAAVSRFGHLPLVPDLESTGLSVQLVSVSDFAGKRMLQIGYSGQHGCHLSLFVAPAAAATPPYIAGLGSAERAYAWTAKGLAYLIFAKGMDTSRFDLIAEKIEAATRANAPLDAQAQQQLAENRRNSASCQA